MVTIGQLAKKVGVRPSTIRFYEQEGLLEADARSEAGYRLYSQRAEDRLRLIQRAQRLGFSLSDVQTMLQGWDNGDLSDAAIIETAENRYLELERRTTDLLVLQHELELFLQDLHHRERFRRDDTTSSFARMLDRVCANPLTLPSGKNLLDWLERNTGCNLATEEGQRILKKLHSLHVHIWQEGDHYRILVVSDDPDVANSLEQLARLESNCQTHSPVPILKLSHDEEGYMLTASGPHAFLFARLFLTLEQESVSRKGSS